MKKIIFLLCVFGSLHVCSHELILKIKLNTTIGNFDAVNSKLKGEVKNENGKYTAKQLWVKVEDFKTGLFELRDEHFKNHLKMKDFPKITLTDVEAQNGAGKGTLNIIGKSVPVNFTYTQENPKKLTATFTIKNSSLGLPKAEQAGVVVLDDIEVVANIDL